MKWAALWCCLPLVLLIQWPHWSVAQSACLNWAAWAALAASVSFLETIPRRTVKFPFFSLVVVALAIRYLSDVLPQLIYTDWTAAWGMVAAFGSGACWVAIVLFGTASIVRNSPSPGRWLAPVLFIFQIVSLLLIHLHEWGIYSFWRISDNPGGFLPTAHIYADISALSVPILFSWAWWAAIPAFFGILISKSMTAMIGLLAGAAWLSWKGWNENKRVVLSMVSFVAFSCVAFLIQTPFHMFVNLILLRVRTWVAAAMAIVRNPLGIGMDALAYSREVLEKTNLHVLPHSASDALNTLLYTGWIGFLILAYLVYRGLRDLGSDPKSVSLVITFAMCCFARVLGFPQVALIAWVVWMAWRIDDANGINRPSLSYGDLVEGVTKIESKEPLYA